MVVIGIVFYPLDQDSIHVQENIDAFSLLQLVIRD